MESGPCIGGGWEGLVVSDCPLTQAAITLERTTSVRYVD